MLYKKGNRILITMKIWKKLQLALCSLMSLGKKGQGTLDTVIAVVVGAVGIIIGLIIVAELFDSITFSDYSTDAEEAMNTTSEMTYVAFGILPIVLLVMAAVAVIAAVLVLRGRR